MVLFFFFYGISVLFERSSFLFYVRDQKSGLVNRAAQVVAGSKQSAQVHSPAGSQRAQGPFGPYGRRSLEEKPGAEQNETTGRE
jgi:hypothetical protein